MTLGDIIKTYRTNNNLSMDAFAEQSGISKAYISLLEKNKHPKSGKTIAPSIQCIKQAAIGMNMDFNELFSAIDGEVSLEESPPSPPTLLGKRLIALRKERGFTARNKFAEILGIPGTTLRNYETGVREPGFASLIQISDFFNVSVDYLLGLTDEKEKHNSFCLKSSELEYIKKYRDLDDTGKEHVDTILDWEVARMLSLQAPAANSSATPTRIISYYQRLASAETGEYLFSGIPTDTITVPITPISEQADFVIGVNSDSMEPTYYDGDKVYIEEADELSAGEIGIFMIDNECYIKEVGHDQLLSHNRKYVPIMDDRKINVVGRVLGKVEEECAEKCCAD